MSVEVVIYQVGSRYAWTLQERLPGLNASRIMAEGSCPTFHAASREAHFALQSYKLRQCEEGNEVMVVTRGTTNGGWHWQCTCGSFGWSYREMTGCPSCATQKDKTKGSMQ